MQSRCINNIVNYQFWRIASGDMTTVFLGVSLPYDCTVRSTDAHLAIVFKVQNGIVIALGIARPQGTLCCRGAQNEIAIDLQDKLRVDPSLLTSRPNKFTSPLKYDTDAGIKTKPV
jgi:hypothetical protein